MRSVGGNKQTQHKIIEVNRARDETRIMEEQMVSTKRDGHVRGLELGVKLR